jgi:type I site-specific restriction-modification system R (restriction) subunit
LATDEQLSTASATPEQFFVAWKDEAPPAGAPVPGALLNRPLAQLCGKARLLDLIRNGVIFDAGRKKLPRPHQYAGFKAAQARLARGEGEGIHWPSVDEDISVTGLIAGQPSVEFRAAHA